MAKFRPRLSTSTVVVDRVAPVYFLFMWQRFVAWGDEESNDQRSGVTGINVKPGVGDRSLGREGLTKGVPMEMQEGVNFLTLSHFSQSRLSNFTGSVMRETFGCGKGRETESDTEVSAFR